MVVWPLLIAAGALGAAAGAWPLAAALAGATLVLAAIGPRWQLDAGRQWLTCAMGGGAGYVAAVLAYEPLSHALGEGWTRFAAAAIGGAGARLLIAAPRGGDTGTVAIGFAGLLAAGETRGHGYIYFVALFLAAAARAMHRGSATTHRGADAVHDAAATTHRGAATTHRGAATTHRGAATTHRGAATTHRGAATRRTHWPGVAVGASIVLVAACLGASTSAGLQRLHRYLTTRARSHVYDFQPRVGFSDKMELGALDGLLDSDEVVLRIVGGHLDYLRGAALDLYESGRWIRSEQSSSEAPLTLDLPAPAPNAALDGAIAPTVEIAAVAERTSRLFLPYAARDIVSRPSAVLVDDLGAAKRAADHGLIRARFVVGPRSRLPVAPPRPVDQHVPRRLRSAVDPIALTWTMGAASAEDKLQSIERHLRTEYAYARAFQRGSREDPIVDFLTRNKRGHCEYFATALALLARSAGIPARVVVGYRVGEESPFGYDVVRERNAHAWVEVWLDGRGWVTRDATPSEALPQNLPHVAGYGASALDGMRVAYDGVTAWFGALSVAQSATAWLVGLTILGFIVARGAERRTRAAAAGVRSDESALPALRDLLARAAEEGHVHREDEPIERFASRWADPDAAALLQRYAQLRYGSALNGDVAGALNGDVAGALNGDVAGALNGDVAGALNGDVAGALNGDVAAYLRRVPIRKA